LRIEIEPLIRLQDVDLQIRKLLEEKAQCPERVEALQEIFANREKELQELRERVADITRRRKEIEEEVEVENIRLGKSQQKLSAVKTNREYQALLKEMDEIKKANKAREDEVIVTMEEADAIGTNVTAKTEELDRTRKELEAEKKHLARVESELDMQIEALSRDRKTIAKDVRKDLLTRYNFLREKRAGVALAVVIDSVCSGCHMNIPPQLYNELLRDERTHWCPMCQRLIYADDSEEKGQG
jgi:predicted  nucleic acid-binding Zn-ribbon protein